MTMKKSISAIMLLAALSQTANAQNAQQLRYWFDRPTSVRGAAVWYGGHPERWNNGNKPIAAGDAMRNPDPEWESQSLPIGNGSIGANIMGSVEAERLTLNEKTLWRGGPNTKKGAAYYWNVNKQSAHVLKDIRQAFADNDWKKADVLTRKNFNSEVPYGSKDETPSRFGSFTTAGELYVETGLSGIGITGYRRELSLDSALAHVQFCKDGVVYRRDYFASYPANIIAVRFAASKQGKQNLVISYAPNPVSEGKLSAEGNNELMWNARLDNNDMQYAVRIKAINKGGSISNKTDALR